MSSTTLAIIENIKERVKNATAEQRAKSTDKDIIQYNIRLDGKVAKTFGINLKDYVFVDGPVAENDVEITIDDADFIGSISNTLSLTDLLNKGKIDVKGDVEVLKMIEARASKHAADIAALKK